MRSRFRVKHWVLSFAANQDFDIGLLRPYSILELMGKA